MTRLWTKTWYDSTLPFWFLDRTFANTSTLATQTCHRFEDGRFYGWEGVDSCPGTCQHVWQYAQAVAHVFPQLERNVREQVDFGLAYHADGSIDYRGEASRAENGAPMPLHNPGEGVVAVDGLAGTIIRVYREHKTSANSEFLVRLWPRVNQSIRFLMSLDADEDGLIEGPQYHTLDATWFGRLPWISSLFLGAMAVGKAMALELGDADLAEMCSARLSAGRENIVRKLFNGRYFEHEADPAQPASMDLGDGCYIDQMLGQSFAHQVGFERVVSEAAARAALESLWSFNFAPDVGPFRARSEDIEGGRWYAMPGEAGLLMCSWPLSPPDREGRTQANLTDDEQGVGITSEGYLNECMTGFEYQVAAHMIAEGLVEHGLSITRAIHDRYDAAKRNPWNEVECGDHYSRAMASYGVFLTACGFDYHGPLGRMAFRPRISAERFRAPFIAAEGWGSFEQSKTDHGLTATLRLLSGQLRLSRLSVEFAGSTQSTELEVMAGNRRVAADAEYGEGGMVDIVLREPILIGSELDRLTVAITLKRNRSKSNETGQRA